jgi:hypothetical protein
MLAFRHQIVSRIKDLLRPHVRPRRFHAFGVALPKTGTHSLAAVFSRYRAWHEPDRDYYAQIVVGRTTGELSDSATLDLLRQLDRRWWLELNSSWLNYFFLDLLLAEYPQAKFVLTIRDCYSWLDSMFNQVLARSHADSPQLAEFYRWYADILVPGSHEDGDRVLAERRLWPLDAWLRFWNQHNTRILALVPRERLLVVRTQDIRREIPRLAEFLGVPPDTLDAGRTHEHKAEAKFGLVSDIDENYLHARVAARCGDLMEKFFPEIRSVSDVPGLTRDAVPDARTS